MDSRSCPDLDLDVYIPTCDANSFVIKYFQYFFNKYWNNKVQVKILGFSRPNFDLMENFEFISLGGVQVNGANGWSNYLRSYFEQIEPKYIIFGIDDFMISRPVDLHALAAARKVIEIPEVGRVDLQPLYYARPKNFFSPFLEIDDIEFVKLRSKSRRQGEKLYRIAGAFSIWKKDWFLNYLHPNWSPWQWEITGSKLSEADGYEVVGGKNRFAIKKSELLSQQWPNIINTLGIREEDVQEMRRLSNEGDRISNFQKVGSGYREFAGRHWERKIYGP
jgi:hypothetical protein